MVEGEEFRTRPFQFSTPRQQRIYSRLRKVGPGPAAFYKDACRHMTDQPLYESTTHLVAHLLREIESGLREVLVTVSSEVVLKGEKDAHKRTILGILRGLEIAESDPVAQAWVSFPSLEKRAHRNSIAAPRPLNEEFGRLWDQMELILDVVLEKFEEHYLIWIAKAEELAKKAKPTNSDAHILRTQLPNNEVVLGHFFAKLDNPDWLPPLVHEGFFEEPYAPIEDVENGRVRYAVWHQSRFLVRMAPLAPDQVLELILKIPDTTNFLIHQDYAEASLKLPPVSAAKLLPKIKQWLDVGRTTGQLNLKLGELLKIFAEDGQSAAALELSHLLLDFVATPDSTGAPVIRFPTAQLDVWYYEQVLTKKFPSVVVDVGQPAFELLCDVLENAISLSRPLGTRRYAEDWSSIWCSSVEIDSGVHIDGKPLLVSAIRDTAELLANADPKSVPGLVKSLRKRRRTIFRRLAHNLLRLHPQSDMADVERSLLSRGMLDPGRSEWPEYSMLMRDCFKLLSPERQRTIVTWVDKGPNITRFKKRFERVHGQAPTDEQIQQFVTIWKKKRIDLISKDLSPTLKSEFALPVALSNPTDETKSPEAVEGAWIYSAPLSVKQIEAMSVDEIASFLNTWKPSGDWMSPNEEGLGSKLTHSIAEQPERFAQGAEKFQGVRAVYINAIVEGFQEAIRREQHFDWMPLIALLKWAVQQSEQVKTRLQNRIADQWYWVRNSIARLISTGFESKKDGMPFSCRTEVWKVLEALCSEPPAIETKVGPESLGEFLGSSETKLSISPEPLLAAMRYAVWVKQHTESQAAERPAHSWFANMPEFQKMLEDVLSHNTDSSVHSVFGERLVTLADLDEQWLLEHLADIFPEDPTKEALWNAAWNAFLFHWQVGARLFEIMRSRYLKAIENISESDSKTKYGQSSGDLLADRIMGLYWWGTLKLDDDLMQKLLEKAPEKVRGHAMHQLGYAVYNDKQGIPPDTLNRVKDLFELRLHASENATDKGFYRPELAAFSWCFASDKFDHNWKMNMLLRILRATRRVEVPHLVVEELAKLSRTTPRECVECLNLLTIGLEDVFEIYGWDAQARTVLTEAINSGDATAKATAVTTVHRLASRGFTNFRDLV